MPCCFLINVERPAVTPPVPEGPCKGQWSTPTGCVGADCTYKATWQYREAQDEIDFTVTSTNSRDKWIGVGFGPEKRMVIKFQFG